jgi:hypothetical protein
LLRIWHYLLKINKASQMTSSMTTTGTGQLNTTGRTVRDIVEYSPELVNEVWCRKILRQILQALDLHYARQQSHAAITPDSIAMQASGDAVLLSAATLPVQNPSEPEDLRALATVIHYAITKELAPEGPLQGRALEGYSASLVSAVDRCMARDPRERPQTIEQLRKLLGIVALGSPLPQTASATPPVVPRVSAAAAAPPRSAAALGRLQRWLLVGAAASVLVVGAVGLYAFLYNQQADDEVVLALPSAQPASPAPGANSSAAAPAPAEATPGAAETQATLPAVTPEPAPAASADTAAAEAEAATVSYKLLVRPWGTVYVNGVERGVSPPLKRLALPPGQHTIRIVNPNFPDRVIKLDTSKNRSGRITHNFSARSRQP